MSNIAVVPHFQNLWSLMYAFNYVGTATCPVLLTNSADLFLARKFLPPPWDFTTMYVTPLAVSLYRHAPSLVLSPCTLLLLILGL